MAREEQLSVEEELSLWRAWRERQDSEARLRLIDHHLPFAQMMAAKLYAARQMESIEFEEYRQYAVVGMLEAIDRFEHEREASFRTYAGYRIAGAVLNGVERYSEKQQQISSRTQLRQQRMKSLKSSVNESDKSSLFAQLADLAIGMALGYMLEDSGMYQEEEPHYTENFYDRYELKRMREELDQIIEVLPPQQRKVIRYHYYQGLTFEQIAELMKLSKGRISQIHNQALKLIRGVHAGARDLDLRL